MTVRSEKNTEKSPSTVTNLEDTKYKNNLEGKLSDKKVHKSTENLLNDSFDNSPSNTPLSSHSPLLVGQVRPINGPGRSSGMGVWQGRMDSGRSEIGKGFSPEAGRGPSPSEAHSCK